MALAADGYRTPPAALDGYTDPQDLTGAWVDLGDELQVDRYKHIGLFLVIDINDSENVRVRCLAKTESGGTNEFVLPIGTQSAGVIHAEDEYYEFNIDADQSPFLSWVSNALYPYVQFQVMAGTVGGTAGQIDEALYSLSK